jgi:hypothetical protein
VVLASVFSLACFAVSFSAPQLVAFRSDDSRAAVNAQKVPHADTSDLTRTQGRVIPASFYIPAAPTRGEFPTVNSKKAKPHRTLKPSAARLVSAYRWQETTPHLVLTRAVKSSAGNEAVSVVQVVVVVETAYVRYGQTDSNGNTQTNATGWRTQVWQIFVAAPAQNSAQVGVTGSVI